MSIAYHPRSRRAFTLVEMLVAVAILAFMIALLGQLTSLSGKTYSKGKKRVDNFTKARAALDLMASDVTLGVFRPDLAAFHDAGGATAVVFFTKRAGVGGDRELSLVSYPKVSDAGDGILKRGSLAIPWSDTTGLGFNTTNSIPRLSKLTNDSYESIATGILRMEIYFIDSSGNFQANYDSTSRSLGVAIAVIDEDTLGILKTSGRLNSLIKALPEQAPPQSSYEVYWGNLLSKPGFYSGMPAPVAENIKVFERCIVLPVVQ